MRHQIEVALAVARERLLEVHTTQAVELIEHAHGQVAPSRALSIYCRLNEVAGQEAVVLGNRVLARLGARQERGAPETRLQVDAPAVVDDWDSPRSWVRRVRRRLGGRKNHALRRWIELHTGRTQVALLGVHVRGVLRLIEILQPETSFADVVEVYTRSMGVPPSLSRTIYFLTLDRLSSGDGPDKPGGIVPKDPEGATPSLRVVTR